MKNDLPNILIVGAAKSGTTSLHNYLNQHPDIFMCSPKEPHFLINQEIGIDRIPVGISEFKRYRNLFSAGKTCKYRGESSVMYLMFPEIVIPKIKKILGENTKIIIMLRNPVDRAYSGYQHNKRYDVDENLEFEEAWNICEDRYNKIKHMTPATRYKELGMYYKQVKSFMASFTNVHVIIYDDYQDDINKCLEKVFRFLSVNKLNLDTTTRHMVGGWEWKNGRLKHLLIKKNRFRSILKKIVFSFKLRKWIRKVIHKTNTKPTPKITSRVKIKLKKYYKEDVMKLSHLLERDLNYWIDN